jgi:hypothetical protein
LPLLAHATSVTLTAIGVINRNENRAKLADSTFGGTKRMNISSVVFESQAANIIRVPEILVGAGGDPLLISRSQRQMTPHGAICI